MFRCDNSFSASSTLTQWERVFCSKQLYWRYDDSKRRMDAGYPHDISRWRGLPSNLDAATSWSDGTRFDHYRLASNKQSRIDGPAIQSRSLVLSIGRTYFFKNGHYWRFNDTVVRTERDYPQQASPHWLGCAEALRRPTNRTVRVDSFGFRRREPSPRP